MSHTTKDRTCCAQDGPCGVLPEPVRMNYFHGQLISERDLRTEQAYFMEKLRHHHRCIHGYGVLCGLEVSAVPHESDCSEPEDGRPREIRLQIREAKREQAELRERLATAEISPEEAKERSERIDAELERLSRALEDSGSPPLNDSPSIPQHIIVSCGAAVDCNGRDLILHEEVTLDLLDMLCGSDKGKLQDRGSGTVYLSICYQEYGREPTRPLAMDSCATTNACRDARIAEGVRFVASLEPPAEDTRCEPCCSSCKEHCLHLASIAVDLDQPLDEDEIDHSARRRFGLYDPTVITGISWRQGRTYSPDEANAILGTKDDAGGIEIAFSRPVRVDSLMPGTIDLFRITGGRGLAGAMIAMEGEFVDLPEDEEFVDRVRYRDATGETVQGGDRIMIIVRAPFILDACCRAVEGLHAGGRVPLIANGERGRERDPDRFEREREREKAAAERAKRREVPTRARAQVSAANEAEELETIVITGSRIACNRPPWGPGPWTSSQPGNFESWFFVGEE